MADINVAWGALVEELALASLAGGAQTQAAIADLDVNDIVGVYIVFNEHPSATAGLRVKVFAREASAGLGTDGSIYGHVLTFDIPHLGTRLETTVDADSSGTTLNLAATTNAALGDVIIIDAGDGNNEEELAMIAAISAGVSVTVADTLINDPTGANASTVEACVTRYVALAGIGPDAWVTIENLDGANAAEVAIFSVKRDWVSA